MNDAILKKLQTLEQDLCFALREEGPELTKGELVVLSLVGALAGIAREWVEAPIPPVQLELPPPMVKVTPEPLGEPRFTRLVSNETGLYALDATGCVWRLEFQTTEWEWQWVSMKVRDVNEPTKKARESK